MQRDERCYKKVASFFVDFQYIAHTGCSVFINVKFVNTISSHAHAYARSTGVFAFLLSQVSQHFRNSLVINTLHHERAYFNKSLIQVSQIPWTKLEKVRFCFVIFPPKKRLFWRRFLPWCDTCDSKKTTLRLECARVGAYIRARCART